MNGAENAEMQERLDQIETLLDNVLKRGVTEGARLMNGHRYVEFPAPPVADLRDFEKTLLRFLSEAGEMRSTTKLAKEFASNIDERYNESIKSRVQYNVETLEERATSDV